MYIYPDHLRAKATLWLWQLRDIGIIGVVLLISVLAISQLGFVPPIVLTAVYSFLTILDFLRYACAFFMTKQQFYEWRYTPNE